MSKTKPPVPAALSRKTFAKTSAHDTVSDAALIEHLKKELRSPHQTLAPEAPLRHEVVLSNIHIGTTDPKVWAHTLVTLLAVHTSQTEVAFYKPVDIAQTSLPPEIQALLAAQTKANVPSAHPDDFVHIVTAALQIDLPRVPLADDRFFPDVSVSRLNDVQTVQPNGFPKVETDVDVKKAIVSISEPREMPVQKEEMNGTSETMMPMRAENRAPEGAMLDMNVVAENAANGTVIGTVTGRDPDSGASFTYSLIDDSGGRFAIDAQSGAISVADGALLDFEAASSHSVTVRVTDQGGLNFDKSFTLYINDINEAPSSLSFGNPVLSLFENADTSSRIKIADIIVTDDMQGAEVFRLSGADTSFFEIDHGVLYLKAGTSLNFETKTHYAVTVEVDDPSVGSPVDASRAFTLAILDINEAPGNATLTAGTIVENAANGTSVGTVTVLDSDMGDSFIYSLLDNAGGRFAIDSATGVVTVANGSLLDFENHSSHSITVHTLDAGGVSFDKAFTIHVTNVNEAPIVTSGATASFAENGTGTVYTATATDPDAGASLSYSLSGADAALFSINSSTGVVTFLSAPNYEAPTDTGADNVYDINVIASDGTLTNTRAVAITVTNVNEAPTVTSGATASFAENGTGTVYTATATDPDAGATLSYSLSGADAALFSIDSSTGVVTFLSAPNYEAPTDAGADNVYDINVIASDGSLTNARAVAITVTNVNEAPTVTSGATASFAENGTGTVYTAAATDPDAGTTLSYSLSGADAALFSIDSSTGVVTFLSAPNYEAPTDAGADNVYDINVIASDGSLTNARAVAITVTNVNEAPTVTSGATASFAENGTGTVYTAAASDPDAGASLSYSLSGADAGLFDINASTGVVTFKASPNYEAPTDTGADNVYDINVIASDGSLTNARAVAITVTNVNEAPTVTSGATASFAENGTGTVYTATASDPDAGATLSYSLSGADAALFSINSSTGVVTFLSAPNYEAPADAGANNVYDINVIVSDGSLTNARAVAITVTNVNEAPTVTSGATASFAENGTGTVYTAAATDPDAGTTLSYSLSGADAALFSIDSSTGVVTFLSAPNYEAPTDAGADNVYDINVIASDGSLTNARAVAITVTNVNEAPTVTSGATASFAENGTGTVYTAAATDPDAGTTLSYSLSGADAALFSINSSTGVVTFLSAPNYEAPTDTGANNVYDINVIASDGTLTNARAVAITVTNVNEAPTVTSGATASFAENGTGTVYTAAATDPDAGTTLSYSLSGADAALFSIDSITGVVTFLSAPNYEAPTDTGANNVYDINVIASDGTLTNTRAVAITVTNVNEAPIVTSGATASFAENGTGTVYTAAATDPDAGATLSYSLSGADAALFSINSSTGVVTFLSAPNYEAPTDTGADNVYDINVIASDGTLTNARAVAITVTNVNEAPTVTSGATASFAENGTGTVYTATASDPDAGATLSYSLSGADAALFSINSSTGVVTFLSAPNYEAPADAGANNVYDINVIVSDGSLTNARAVAITVTNVNEAPTVTSGATASFAENGTGTVYTAAATDPDAGTTLSYSLSGADAALFSIDSSTGVVTFLSAPNYEAPTDAGADNVYDINVIASDGSLTNARAVAITVTNVNEAPTVTSGATASFAENGTGTVYTAAASDPDAGASLSYSLSGADAGLFDINASTGVVTFKASPNYEAPTDTGADNVYDINVIASDGSLTNARAVAITVTNVNEAPTVTSGATASFAENGTGTVYTATASDPDAGATLSYSLSGADAALFSINSSTGVVTFLSAPNYEAPADAGANNVYDINVIVSDGSLTNARAVAITVTNVNEAPTVTSGATASFAENGTGTVYTAAATDPDAGASLSYSLSGADAGLFDINASTGVVTFKASPNYEAPTDTGADNVYDINVIASDGSLTNARAVAITVTNVNEAPTVTSGATASFAENGTGTVYTATATDPDAGATLSYSLSGADAALFSINSSTGVVTFLSAPNYEAPADAGANNVYDINVIVSDGSLTNARAVAITVTNVNEAPTVTSGATASFAENGTGTVYTAAATDPDAGTTLSYSLSGADAALFSIDSSTGVVTFLSAPNYEAPTDAGADNVYDINVIASDGSLTNARAVAITVTNVNEAPTVTSGATASFAENGTGTVYTAAASDPDAGASLSYSLSGADAGLFDINASTGVVTFKASPNYEAPTDTGADNVYDINVIASDGSLTNARAVAITVTNVNEAPTVTSGATASFAENGTGTVYTATASDPDAGATLSYSLSGADAALFSINSSTGVVTFLSAPNYEAPADAGANNVYDINVIVSDGSLTNARAVAITVTNVNEAPTVTSGATASFAENGTGTVYTAAATDPDAGTTLSYSLSGADAALFSIDSSTGVVTFLSAPNYEAPTDAGADNVYDINVIASDGSLTNARAVAITVTNVNEAPTVTSGATASFAENGTGTVYTAAATDPDAGTTLSYSLSGADAALFSINSSTGVVTFLSAPNYEAPTDTGANNVYDINVIASDGTLTNARAVAITVTNVNEAPTVTSGATASFAENGTGTVYTAAATDPDAGTTLSYSLSGADAALFSIDSITGVVTFLSAPNYEAPTDTGANNVYDINVIASDGTLTNTRAVAITVTNVNEAPIVTSGATASFAENGTGTVYTAAATDPDAGATLSYSLSGADAALFSINSSTGVVTFLSAPNYEAPTDTGADNVYDINVIASDGTLTNARAVAITVTNVNEAPTVTSGATASFAENGTGTVYTATASDPDAGATLSYSLSGADAALFSINSSTGVVTFLSAPNYEAPADAGANNVYDINVIVSDGSLTNARAVAITVTNVNEAPTVTSGATASFAENGTGTVYTAAATDPDAGTTLSYSLSGADAALFSIDSSTGVVTFLSAPNYEAPTDAGADNVYDINVIASDGSLTNARAVAITVTNVNEAPTVTSGATASFAENGTGTVYTAAATDPDAGTTLSYSLSGADAALFSINSSTGVVTFLSAPNYEAPADAGANNVYDINVIVSDGSLTNIRAVAITVTNVNEAPIVTSGATASFAENGTGTVYTAAATDPDAGATLSYSLSGADAALFSIDSSTGVVTFLSAPNYEAPTDTGADNVYDINVIASDGTLTNTRAVAITVTNVNEAPIVTSGATASFAENGTGTVYTATATDPDAGATLSYSLSGADAGLFDINSSTGAVTFKTAPDYEAPTDSGANNVYDIIVTASDGALSATKAVAITVTNVSGSYTGTAGNDTIVGSSEEDAINATQGGNDSLSGGTGNDTITAGSGNDTIEGGVGGDSLIGGAGTDTLSYASSSSAVTVDLSTNTASGGDAQGDIISGFENIIGSTYDDNLTGDGNANSIISGAGNDTVYGGGGNDTITGGTGTDSLYGGNGNDLFLLGSSEFSGAELIDGGAGTDTISLSATNNFSTGSINSIDALTWTAGGTATLDASQIGTGFSSTLAITGNANINALAVNMASAGTMDISNWTFSTWTLGTDTITLVGSTGDDSIIGSSQRDNIDAGTGNDIVNASNGGDDTLNGGAGNDTLTFANATTGVGINLGTSSGQGTSLGTLTISGFENLIGTDYNDSFGGDNNANIIYGGLGNDTIAGNAGADSVYGGAGNDSFNIGYAEFVSGDLIDGGTGNDTIIISRDANFSLGSVVSIEALTFNGSTNNTATIDASQIGSGFVSTLAVTGDTTINALAINMASTGTLDISGWTFSTWTAGTDTITLTGSTGNDSIIGAASQRNNINGGNGNDTIQGGSDNDTLTGGAGTNIVSYANAAAGVTVNLGISTAQNTGGAGTDTLSSFQGIIGSGYNDSLKGTNGNDTLYGGAGNDTIDGWINSDVLDGGEGSDTYLAYGSSSGFDSYVDTGTSGTDIIKVTASGTIIGVSTSLDSTSGIEQVDLNGYTDAIIQVTNWANIRVDLSQVSINGAVVLTAGWGNQTLVGSSYNDTISGGQSTDSLYGGGGNDLFTFAAGDFSGTEIVDGGTGTDTISISGSNTFSTGTITSIEALTYTAAATATLDASQLGSGFSSTLAVTGDGNINALAIAMANAGTTNISGWTFTTWTAGTDTITLTGSTGNDSISGSSQSDSISAGNGNDSVTGGAGNDTIDGGAGTSDRAIYFGNWADYAITQGSDAGGSFYQLADRRVGSPDGTDKVYNVEVFQFADRAITVTTANDLLNEAPTNEALSANTVSENAANGTVIGTVSTTDPDAGDSFTYSLTGNANGRFAINAATGVITVADGSQLDYESNASHSITVRTTDAGGLTYDKAFTINVTNVNEAPTVTSGASASFAENGTGTVYTATATDPDAGTTLSYSLSGTDAALFSVNSSTGVVTFLSAPNYEAPADTGANNVYDINVIASDGSLTNTRAVAITVTNVNEAPIVTSGATASFAENGTGTVYTAAATDPDAGATLSYSLSGTDAALFSINSSTGVVTFLSAPNYEAPTDAGANNVYDINVIASDGSLTNTRAVAITVTNVNEAPTVTSGATASFAENGTGTVYTATASDPDAGTTLRYSLSGADAALFSIDSSTGVVTFLSAPNYEVPTDTGADNVYDINVIASDGTLTNAKAVAITVTNVNEAPIVTSGATASFAENGTGTVYTAAATDPDAGTTLSYSLSGADAALFSINSSTGVVTFLSAPNYEAPADAGANNVYDINVIVSDGSLTNIRAVAITVTNVNEAPTVTSGATASFAENGTGTVYTATATDPDAGATLSYSLSGADAALFSINSSTGVVTFLSAPNYEAPADAGANNVYDINVIVSDGSLTNIRAVAITVTNVNEAPIVTSGATASFAENGTGTVYTAAATDPDAGATLSYSLSGADAALFSINSSTGVVTFLSAPNYEAPTDAGANNVYDINVVASDGTLTNSRAVAITVTNVNEAPIVTSGATASFAENGTGTVYTATATDPDAGATLSYSLSGADAALFSINSSTGVVTFLSAPNYEAPTDAGANNVYDINVVASDGTLTNSRAVAITVTNVNEAPIVTSGATASFAENGTGTVYTATATDPDAGATLSYSLSGADAAKFAINASTGVVTFVSSPDYETPTDAGADNVYNINVIASDGTLTNTRAVAITVTDVVESGMIYGTAGADNLVGTSGNDSISAGDGDDTIFGGGGIDTIDGGVGTDLVKLSGRLIEYSYTLDGSNNTFITDMRAGSPDGTATLKNIEQLFAVTDNMTVSFFSGTSGNDSLYLNGSDGILIGGAGDDSLEGGDAHDFALLIGGAGNDTLVGNINYAISAVADYYDATSAITVSLAIGSAQNTGGAGIDTLTYINYLAGSIYNDNLTGDGNANGFWGRAGNDTINGGGGNDTLYGGAGNDSLIGGSGTDNAAYYGISNAYSLSLDGSNNVVVTDIGSGYSDGTDTLITIEYLEFSDNTFKIYKGTSGADTLTGSTADDILIGGAGNDSLNGGTGNDFLVSGAGNDTLTGGSGTDTVSYASAGSAVTVDLSNAAAQNTIGAGTDTLATLEYLVGSAYGDTLTGSSSANMIWGYDGNDTVIGGAGADSLYGGNGNDQFNYAASGFSSGEMIDGGAGTDTIYITASTTITSGTVLSIEALTYGAAATFTFSDTQVGTGLSSTFAVTGDGNANALAVTLTGTSLDLSGWTFSTWTAGTDTIAITGSGGNDLIYGSSQNDSINGGAGNDTIIGGAGNDTIDGSTGTDTVSYATAGSAVTVNLATATAQNTLGAGTDTITNTENLVGSAYNDTLTGDGNANALYGGAGNDTVDGGAGNDTIDGGAGNDSLIGGSGTDTLSYASAGTGITIDLSIGTAQNTVGAGTDTISGFENLTGSSYADTLTGDANDNIFTGGLGNDTVYGGNGSDIFVQWVGHGQDALYGGTGASWTDTIELHNASGALYGGSSLPSDWTLTLTSGSAGTIGAGFENLSQDAAGYIVNTDGTRIDFQGIEKITW